MRVTARVDYAVRVCVELAAAPPRTPVKGETLASRQQIPGRFLEQLLADLRRAGVVCSARGAVGGYWLARDADDITVADVIRAIEGPLADVHGSAPENLEFVPPVALVREVWVATRAALRGVLESVSLGDLARGELPDEVTRLLDAPGSWQRRPRR